jgi:hypothetical protein
MVKARLIEGLVGPDGFPFYLVADVGDSFMIKYGRHYQEKVRFAQGERREAEDITQDMVFAQIKSHLARKRARCEEEPVENSATYDDACAMAEAKKFLVQVVTFPSFPAPHDQGSRFVSWQYTGEYGSMQSSWNRIYPQTEKRRRSKSKIATSAARKAANATAAAEALRKAQQPPPPSSSLKMAIFLVVHYALRCTALQHQVSAILNALLALSSVTSTANLAKMKIASDHLVAGLKGEGDLPILSGEFYSTSDRPSLQERVLAIFSQELSNISNSLDARTEGREAAAVRAIQVELEEEFARGQGGAPSFLEQRGVTSTDDKILIQGFSPSHHRHTQTQTHTHTQTHKQTHLSAFEPTGLCFHNFCRCPCCRTVAWLRRRRARPAEPHVWAEQAAWRCPLGRSRTQHLDVVGEHFKRSLARVQRGRHLRLRCHCHA